MTSGSRVSSPSARDRRSWARPQGATNGQQPRSIDSEAPSSGSTCAARTLSRLRAPFELRQTGAAPFRRPRRPTSRCSGPRAPGTRGTVPVPRDRHQRASGRPELEDATPSSRWPAARHSGWPAGSASEHQSQRGRSPQTLLAEASSGGTLRRARGGVRFEPALAARVESQGEGRSGELGERPPRSVPRRLTYRRAASEAAERLTRIQIEAAGLTPRARRGRRPPARGPGREHCAPGRGGGRPARQVARRLERRRETLGQVTRSPPRPASRSSSRSCPSSANLERSLKELEGLRARACTRTSWRISPESLRAAGERHFTEVAETLFPGGKARLTMTESGRGAGDRDRAPRAGREADHAPLAPLGRREGAGRATRSSSRSSWRGRAPSTSSTRSRLRSTTRTSGASSTCARFAGRAQFIVVTHQKSTMEARGYPLRRHDGRRRGLAESCRSGSRPSAPPRRRRAPGSGVSRRQRGTSRRPRPRAAGLFGDCASR